MSKLPFKKPHLKSLTGLRFFAAIYVVLFHHGNTLCILGTGVCNLISYGYVSVSLFFILSGFVLSYVYLDIENIQPVKAKRFWIARFARIYPLYLLSLLVSLPSFASKFEYFLGPFITTLKGVFSALLSLLLLQAWTPWTSTTWNTPTWAVSNEAFFYFIFPFIALPIARLSGRKIILFAALLWMLALLPPSVYLIFSETKTSLSSSGLWMPFFAYSPWFHLPQFLIGVCTGLLFSKKGEWNSKDNFSPIIGVPMLGLSCLLILSVFTTNPDSRYLFLNNGLLAPPFCILIYYLAEGTGWLSRFLASAKMLVLGEASYAIYLFQNPLLSFMKRIPIKLSGIDLAIIPFPNLIFLILYMLGLIIFSVFAAYFIEFPLRKIVINRLNK